MRRRRSQNDDCERLVPPAVTQVVGRRAQLTVGVEGDHLPVARCADAVGVDERHARRFAGKPRRGTGHLQSGVFGEQALDARHVGVPEGGQVAVQDAARTNAGRLRQVLDAQGQLASRAEPGGGS